MNDRETSYGGWDIMVNVWNFCYGSADVGCKIGRWRACVRDSCLVFGLLAVPEGTGLQLADFDTDVDRRHIIILNVEFCFKAKI